MGGQEKPIVDVQPLCIGFAFGPWLDVTGTQKAWLGETGNGAAAAPVDHQSIAKHILPNPLDNQSLGLGRARQVAGFSFKDSQRLDRQ